MPLWGAVATLFGLLTAILSWLLSSNPDTPIYRVTSNTLAGIGVGYLAGAALQFKFWQGEYWVFAVVGFAAIILGAVGNERARLPKKEHRAPKRESARSSPRRKEEHAGPTQ
jgi:uncharacterized membrane protein